MASPGEDLKTAIVADMREAGTRPDSREEALLDELVAVEDTLQELAAVIEREGYTVTTSKGDTTVHAAVGEARRARQSKLKLLAGIDLGNEKDTAGSQRGRKAAQQRWGPKRGHSADEARIGRGQS